MKKGQGLTMRSFGFGRLADIFSEEDITEWFSDNDSYLADIIHDDNVTQSADLDVRMHC